MNDYIQIITSAIPMMADAWGLLMAVPFVVRLLLVLWITWIMYLAYTSLERAHKMGKVGKVAWTLAFPLVVIFWPLDVLLNVTLFSLLFWEIPKELTITSRLSRHHRDSFGWRYSLAHWFGAELLDPFDADGYHISPRA